MRNSLLLFVLLGISAPLSAQPRLLHVVSRPPVWAAHETWHTMRDMAHYRDPYWSTMAWSLVGAYTADMTSTKLANIHCPSCIEVGPIFKGTHATWNLAIGWGLIDGATLVASHRLNRTHTAWRSALAALPAFGVSTHAQAAWHNSQISSITTAPESVSSGTIQLRRIP